MNPNDDVKALRELGDFLDRCAIRRDSGMEGPRSPSERESFTLTWAQFSGSAPTPNLTGCTATLVSPDEVVIFKPKH